MLVAAVHSSPVAHVALPHVHGWVLGNAVPSVTEQIPMVEAIMHHMNMVCKARVGVGGGNRGGRGMKRAHKLCTELQKHGGTNREKGT